MLRSAVVLLIACAWVAGAAGVADARPADSKPIQPDELDATSAIPSDVTLIEDQYRRRAAATRREPFSPPPAFVKIRLSPVLGADLPAIREKLARYDFVQIGEPADYVLTTKPEFTQTLMLVDAAAGEQSLRPEAGTGSWGKDHPGPKELGNLALHDYDGLLLDALQLVHRAKALLEKETSPQASETMICVQSTNEPEGLQCRIPGVVGGRPTEFEQPTLGPQISVAVRNTSRKLRYLYLFGIAPNFQIQQFALPNGGKTAAGKWTETKSNTLNTFLYEYHYRFVTIAASKPIPATTLASWAAADPNASTRFDTDNQHWSISTFDFAFTSHPVLGVGHGEDAPQFSAPWAVQIYATVPYTQAEIDRDAAGPPDTRKFLRERSPVERDHSCGGTLIADNLVLTAAHCVAKGILDDPEKKSIFVRRRIRAGTHKLGTSGTTFAIDAVAVHAGYQPKRSASPDDIALLLLKADRGTRRVDTASPIELARNDRSAAERVAVYGWGVTSFVDERANWVGTDASHVNHNPDMLQFGEMQMLAWDACKTRLKDLLSVNMMCTAPISDPTPGSAKGPVFSCVGDSGGPLIGEESGRSVLVGIVSWSKGCGVKDFPDVYTNVARYTRWVAQARAVLKSGDHILVPDPKGSQTREATTSGR